MKKTAKIITLTIFAFLIGFVWVIYALFHGAFDHGKFEVEQTELFSTKQLAVVAKRSDHQALSGNQYFIVVGDHPLSPADLKHAYYDNGVVFRAGSDCLTVRWESARELKVTCKNHFIKADQIAVQQKRIGDIQVVYENIPTVAIN